MALPKIPSAGQVAKGTVRTTARIAGKTLAFGGALAYGTTKTVAAAAINSVAGANEITRLAQSVQQNTSYAYNRALGRHPARFRAPGVGGPHGGGGGGSSSTDIATIILLLNSINSSTTTTSQSIESLNDFANNVQQPWMQQQTGLLSQIANTLSAIAGNPFQNRADAIAANANQPQATPAPATSGLVANALGGLLNPQQGEAAVQGAAATALENVTAGVTTGAGLAIGSNVIQALRGKLLLQAGGIATAVVAAAIDGVSTAMNADQWDTRQISAALGGVIAGKDQELQSMFSNIVKGGAAGAAVGSMFPVVGTFAGAIVGATLGAVANAIGPQKVAEWTDGTIDAVSGMADIVFGTTNYYDPEKLKARVQPAQDKLKAIQEQVAETTKQIVTKQQELATTQQAGDTDLVQQIQSQLDILQKNRDQQTITMRQAQTDLDNALFDFNLSLSDHFKEMKLMWEDMSNLAAGKPTKFYGPHPENPGVNKMIDAMEDAIKQRDIATQESPMTYVKRLGGFQQPVINPDRMFAQTDRFWTRADTIGTTVQQTTAAAPFTGNIGSSQLGPVLSPNGQWITPPKQPVVDMFTTPPLLNPPEQMPKTIYNKTLQDSLNDAAARRAAQQSGNRPPLIIQKSGDTTIIGGNGGSGSNPGTLSPADARPVTSGFERPTVYGDRFSIFDVIP